MPTGQYRSSRGRLLLAILGAFALASLLVARLLTLQPPGLDFLCFWAGGHAALTAPARLYDFDYVTTLQGLPFASGVLRPYINPPSALLLFAPLSRLPPAVGYATLMLAGLAVLLLAARSARAPWWLLLLPPVAFVLFCGQLTLLTGGCVLLALTFRDRPLIAGSLFALVAVLKPQVLILLPIALVAQGGWLTLLVTGAVGLGVSGLAALVFGVEVWRDWLEALPRFHRLVSGDLGLLETSITPYAQLAVWGGSGRLVFLLAPVVAWAVWTTFRRNGAWPDQLIVLLGGALLVSPYAMNYELALLVPAVAAYLARLDDRRWLLYAAAAVVYALNSAFGPLSLIAALALPFVATTSAEKSAQAEP